MRALADRPALRTVEYEYRGSLDQTFEPARDLAIALLVETKGLVKVGRRFLEKA